MSRKFIRIIAVLFATFAAAMALPKLYRLVPASGSEYNKVVYSEVLNDFIVSHYVYTKGQSGAIKAGGQTEYRDTKGNVYTNEQLYDLVLLENASQLIYDNRLPDSICGVAVTPELLSSKAYTMYFGDGSGNSYNIYDLKDKMSYTSKELATNDLFRMTDSGMEFIDAPTNSVLTEKTEAFTNAMRQEGFEFPAQRLWNPSDRTDSEMLGYFITDNKNELYRVGMVYGKPEVEKLSVPSDKKISNINFTDRAEFLAMVVMDDGTLYTLDRDYQYCSLPLPSVKNMRISMDANLLFRKFTYSYYDRTEYFVTDTLYNVIDSCSISHKTYDQTSKYKVQQVIFPFMIQLTPWDGIEIRWSEGWWFLLFNLIFVALTLCVKRLKREQILDPFILVDLTIVLIFGIFGFAGVWAMPAAKQNRANK